jgi:hypothetical protein
LYDWNAISARQMKRWRGAQVKILVTACRYTSAAVTGILQAATPPLYDVA